MKAILFPGQGAQFKGMGKRFFGFYPGLTQLASDITGCDIKELCLNDPGSRLSQTQYTQPAIYTVNAFAHFEREHEGDAKPDFFCGHSVGEYNALLAAGAFDFETGLRLVAKRGQLMAAAASGGMTAVLGLTADRLRGFLQQQGLDGLDLANYNTATQIVVAGKPEAISEANRAFLRNNIASVPLNVSAPFHSRYMKGAAAEFDGFVKQFAFSELKIPVIANVTGRPYEKGSIARNLSDQIASPVLWLESIRYLIGTDPQIDFQEVGSGILIRMIKEIRSAETMAAVSSS